MDVLDLESEIRDEIQEIRANIDPDDASTFQSELTAFLDSAKEKALQSKTLRNGIAELQKRIAEVRAEIEELSALRPALADSVNVTATKYEQARAEYNENEFTIARLENQLVMRQSELAGLRRQLEEIATKREK